MTNDLTYRDYRDEINLLADVIEDRLEEGEEHPSDLVWEEVDNSQWIIYNHKNLKVIEFAENTPDEWKHMVRNESDWWEICQAYAYKCMEADLYEELRRRDVEV